MTVSIPFIDGLSQEIRRIARTAGVRCAFTTSNTLKVLYAVKDKLPEECTTYAIYSIRCKTCDVEYVGETLRQVGARKKEHTDAVRLGHDKKSAIAEYVHRFMPAHEIDWSSTTVIARARKKGERKIKESLHICKRKPELNRDIGMERSEVWNAVI